MFEEHYTLPGSIIALPNSKAGGIYIRSVKIVNCMFLHLPYCVYHFMPRKGLPLKMIFITLVKLALGIRAVKAGHDHLEVCPLYKLLYIRTATTTPYGDDCEL